MSFLRHGQIYQSDVFFGSGRGRSCFRLRPRSHRFDEFAASYSLAGWSPPEPTSALPAGFIFDQPAETFNHLLRGVAYFSTGRMGNFQPVLTKLNFGRRATSPDMYDISLKRSPDCVAMKGFPDAIHFNNATPILRVEPGGGLNHPPDPRRINETCSRRG
jgi:hypothetical protein